MSRHIYFRFYTFLLFGLVLCTQASAQVQSLPGSVDAGRFDERFDNSNADSSGRIIKPNSINVDETIIDAENGFVLNSVVLNATKAFSRDQLDFLIDDYIGRRVDLKVLNQLAARLTQHYRDHGYFLSRALVPEQDVKNGIVRIQIIEGYVHDVTLDDPDNHLDKSFSSLTQKVSSRIKALDPLHGPTLERLILLLNQGSAITVQSVLEPAVQVGLKPGAVNVILKVTPEKSSINFGLDNHGSRFVGPYQSRLGYVTGAVLTPYDTLSLQTTVSAPLSELQYGQIRYDIPISASGLMLRSAVSYSNAEPGLNLRALDVQSNSFSFETGLSYPVIKTRKTNLDLAGQFTVRNSSTEFLDQELIDDKIRAIRLSADLNRKDSWKGVTSLNFGVHRGLNIMQARKTGSQNLSRTQGRSDFFKATLEASRKQFISRDWSIIAKAHGQFSPHPLLSSEEFGYGGSFIGRAYDPSELTGDNGISAAIEARYTSVPTFQESLNLVPFAFYDIGKVWNKDAATAPESAASAGIGSYYSFNNYMHGSLTVAWPLTKDIDTPIMNGDDGPRLLFEINIKFR